MFALARLFLVIPVLLLSCSIALSEPKVVVSIKPIHSIVSAVMEGVGEADVLITGASSPHDYALKPSQARALQDADLVFWVGEELETFLKKPLATIASRDASIRLLDAKGLVVYDFRDELSLKAKDKHDDHDHDTHKDEHHDHKDEHEGHDHDAKKDDHDDHDHAAHKDEHEGHDHDDHKEEHAEEGHGHGHEGHKHAGSLDGHIWLDPKNASVIANAVATKLSEIDAENASTYLANADQFTARMNALEREVSKVTAELQDSKYVVFHDAYQYFEKRFGLKPSGVISISPEVKPGADRVRNLRKLIADAGVACVFSEPQFSPALVNTLIEGMSVKTHVLDPLGAEIGAGVEHYETLVRSMASAFQECLS